MTRYATPSVRSLYPGESMSQFLGKNRGSRMLGSTVVCRQGWHTTLRQMYSVTSSFRRWSPIFLTRSGRSCAQSGSFQGGNHAHREKGVRSREREREREQQGKEEARTRCQYTHICIFVCVCARACAFVLL